MRTNYVYQLSQQVDYLRTEISTTTQQANRDTQTLSKVISSLLTELEKRNREMERKLVELNKMLYDISYSVKNS